MTISVGDVPRQLMIDGAQETRAFREWLSRLRTIAMAQGGEGGLVTLVTGSGLVTTNSITTSSRILLSHNTTGGTMGHLYVSARNPGANFTISSTSGSDTSTVCWQLFDH